MAPGTFWCWVEGNLDYRFLQAALKHCGVPWHPMQRFWNQEPVEVVNCLLRQFHEKERPYLFLADTDKNSMENRKAELLSTYNLDPACLLIVHGEIEAWFLAGLPLSQIDQYGPFHESQKRRLQTLLTSRGGMDGMTKSTVEPLVPGQYRGSKKALQRWYVTILNGYDWSQASYCSISLEQAIQAIVQFCHRFPD